MNKQELQIEIYYELDMIRLLSKLSEFAIMNDADIEIDTYTALFWDMRQRSNRISERIEDLHPLFPPLAGSEDDPSNDNPDIGDSG